MHVNVMRTYSMKQIQRRDKKNYGCLRTFEQLIARINYVYELFKAVFTSYTLWFGLKHKRIFWAGMNTNLCGENIRSETSWCCSVDVRKWPHRSNQTLKSHILLHPTGFHSHRDDGIYCQASVSCSHDSTLSPLLPNGKFLALKNLWLFKFCL